MFKISKTSHGMYLPLVEPGGVKPTIFQKHLAGGINGIPEKKQETQLLNKATLMSSSSFNFLTKSLWVNSNDKRSRKLREIVQSKNCSVCKNNCNDQTNHLKLIIKAQIDAKYLTSEDYFNSKLISDIMYNEPRHIVSTFKDYLIFDDFSEYLKRSYNMTECIERLPRIFQFYISYTKLFPTFVAMGEVECKYMFKNIERK